MSRFADGAWGDSAEGSDDSDPFGEGACDGSRDTIETPAPVDSAGGFPIEGTDAAVPS